MLLSMFVMLCGTSFAEDKVETIDLVGDAWDNITVSAAGVSSTGGNMNISQGDVVVTSELGYAKKGEMSIYKTGSLTIALSENIVGYITKVELTLTNSYNFEEPGGDWTSEYSTPGTSTKVAKGETETFTTTATNLTSLTLHNAAAGKTGLTKIVVEYTQTASSELLTPTMSFSETEFTVTEGDAFTPPTLNYDGDGAITYSSSAPNVASGDEATGAVEIVSAGTASIIATAAKTDTYKSASASYTITVYVADNNKIFYVEGLPKYDDPKCLKETTWGKNGIRKVFMTHVTEDQTQPVLQVMKAKAALDAKKDKEQMPDSTYQNELKKIKAGEIDGEKIQTMTIIIKATNKATYKNVIDALDEMQICSVGKYVLDKISPDDAKLLKSKGINVD